MDEWTVSDVIDEELQANPEAGLEEIVQRTLARMTEAQREEVITLALEKTLLEREAADFLDPGRQG